MSSPPDTAESARTRPSGAITVTLPLAGSSVVTRACTRSRFAVSVFLVQIGVSTFSTSAVSTGLSAALLTSAFQPACSAAPHSTAATTGQVSGTGASGQPSIAAGSTAS